MRGLRVGALCGAMSVMATVAQAQQVETIDFESLDPGCIVSEVTGDGGSGPIGVNGVNPGFPGENAAVIFDSSNPTGGDIDLGTPNETFGGPGVGAAGEMGMPFENAVPLGNLLIIDEDGGAIADPGCPDGFIADPDDADVVGSMLNFDFSAIGPVFIDSITILDTEPDEEDPDVVTLFDGMGNMITTEVMPTPGDNGVAMVFLGDVPNVSSMSVQLNGSGAIDDIVFCMCDDDDPCTVDSCVRGQCINEPIDCNDNDACTNDACVAGECVNDPISCDDQDECTGDYCIDGECFNDPMNCDDQDDCTTDECVDGECVNTSIDCDDEDDCTIDECEAGQCSNTPIDCDDNDECTDDRCVDGECINEDNGECGLECRMTGGGHDTYDGHRYTFGGQAGAPTAAQPQPRGEWTHHEQRGPGRQGFIFHAGTSSAPEGTEIDLITCSDPGWCMQARPAPAKQLDFEGVGTFKNLRNATADLAGVVPGETYHWFEVHVEDLGEPGSTARQASAARRGAARSTGRHAAGQDDVGPECPAEGSAGGLANCGCPDFYHITIYAGVEAGADLNKTDVIYEVYGYLDGGNLQLHPPVGN